MKDSVDANKHLCRRAKAFGGLAMHLLQVGRRGEGLVRMFAVPNRLICDCGCVIH